ncbi:carcinoembryonic antigen-related cell adhesion molecule 5 isoform X1 [Ictalurus punctatus]|uniref:Carcinoembryonic antigen-related cell adhesion molecule 5 isoform X1 n=1 Tax=Ictalurus punctatus TaxID=7998 RepID=A0A9F7RIY1_ICTPU|nr:carcinoembryonic antigen-related cell adhesion molecule 5 isoform X1 [Ictalurus punctatus]XP_053537359.1 carcinoembryonic antigen-related cell adhesion molecule 5 isoform X1 [Ictalurus punctatus]
MELRPLCVFLLLMGLIHCTTAEKPKPTVRVSPQSSVYTGDSVTLTCNLKSNGWTFLWYKDRGQVAEDTNTLHDTVSNAGETVYQCKARRGNYDSEISDTVTLTVRVRPKPVVKVQPAERVFIGETVTLTCERQTGESWRYLWYRNNEELSDAAGKKTYTITDIKEFNKGDYTCEGTQSSDPKYTQTSDGVTLTVSEKPKPQLTSDLKGAALTGNSVTLYCTMTPQSAGWKFYWIKPTQSTETETHSYTIYISSVRVSDGGQCRCRAGRGNPVYYTHYSDAFWVNVTESPKPVVIIKPYTQVFRGERVTFRCDIQGGDTEWTYDWYRDDNTFYTSHTAQEFSISDYYSGEYTCRGRRRSDSQISKTSDPVTLTVSQKPKPTVRVNSQSSVYTGDRVTLNCNLLSNGWTFLWYRDYWQSIPLSPGTRNTNTLSVTVSNEGETRYYCKARRGNYDSEISDPVTITVRVRPKAVVIIKPDKHVFRGETVTLRCEIQGGGDTEWTYSWYKKYNTLYPSRTTQEFSFSSVRNDDSAEYTCRGRRSDSQSSEISDAVTLTVSEKPKPELTSSREGAVLTGNSVNLSCTLTPQSAGWKFYWIKPTQSTETETETETDYYNISSVRVSDGGQYRCRAGRGNPVYYTHYSDALWVNVTESAKAVVTIKPDKHVFRGETVTLRCEIQGGGDTEWTYSWDKKYNTLYPSRTTQEFSFSSVRNDDSAEYTCRGRRSDSQSSEISDAVTLTVSDAAEAVVSVSPLRWLTEGDSVTLSCEVKHSSTGWTFSWYTEVPSRDSQGSLRYSTALLSDSSRGSGGSYTLSPVTVNHTGVYMCRAERGEPVFHTRDSNLQPLCITGEEINQQQ